MVDAERRLEAVCRLAAAGDQRAGVVHQHVELLVTRLEVRRELPDRRERAEVGEHKLDARASRALLNVGKRRLAFRAVAARHDDGRAHAGERGGGLLADALVGAGHDADFAGHISGHGAPLLLRGFYTMGGRKVEREGGWPD